MKVAILIVAVSLALAATAGFMTRQALSQDEPTRTETITIRDGEPGPAGPRGPAGPPGGTTCPDGYEFGRLVINHPGGQVTILTCMEE